MIVNSVLSFISGLITVLAPCVLPFLPVIVGGSLTGQKWRPYVVAASLVASLFAFTLLLKATTSLLFIDPFVWQLVSGLILILLGANMFVGGLWDKISERLHLSRRSHALLEESRQKEGLSSAILCGLALGPVFSSCNPAYGQIIASVLPADFGTGLIYLLIYCAGVAISLLAIALLGRGLIKKLSWAANPNGIFQKSLGIIFVLVGLSIATGLDKQIQIWLTSWTLGLLDFEMLFLPKF